MANQIITNVCNANCGFCFAAESRTRSLKENRRQMDETEMRDWLAFTMAAGIKELRLLGGEPTIHPRFADFVRIGCEAGCRITVFTNGVMPDPALEALAALDTESCTVVVNTNAAIRPEDRKRQFAALKRLGERVTPGMTLTSVDFTLTAPLALIDAFGLRKAIRIGIANPTWGGSNCSVPPSRYSAVGQTLFEQSFIAARWGVALEPDCGFVRCMFGMNFDKLNENGFKYVSRCAPVVDMCTGGMMLPCFGLSGLIRLDRRDYPDAKAAFDRFTEALKPWHSFGIYPECTQCRFFETEECCGGCLSARLRRLVPMGDK